MSNARLDKLVQALHQNHCLELDDRQLTALLGWLTRSARNQDGQRLSSIFGEPGNQPQLMNTVLNALDDTLFDGERLKDVKAGVGPDQTNDFRHHRFRLLMGAFHPDRFPEYAERLTNRSQIITHAYAGFKAMLSASDRDDEPLRRKAPPTSRPRQYKGITPSWRVAKNLRDRWGQDRFLAHKIIGLLILAMALPLVSVLLEDSWHQTLPGSVAESHQSSELATIQSSGIDGWPPPEQVFLWSSENMLSETKEPPPTVFRGSSRPEWLQPQSLTDKDSDQVIDAEMPENPVETALAEALPGGEVTTSSAAEGRGRRYPAQQLKSDDAVHYQTEPVFELGEAKQIAAAHHAESASGQDEARQVMAATLPPGSLVLGPLQNHQIGALLTNYRQSIEHGDLEGILNVLGRLPRKNSHEGREWFEQHYRALFEQSSGRTLALQVLSARRNGNDWLLQVGYLLNVERVEDGRPEELVREVHYSISPDPFQLRIVGVEY